MKRAKRKSQPKKKAKKKPAKTAATPKKKSRKKVLAALPRILAVAIGDPNNTRPIDSIAKLSIPNPCRPYVTAMVDQLMNQPTPRLLGTHYVIDYEECFEGGEDLTVTPNTALILCMSTPVMWAAVNSHTPLPIVGVTSNPGAFPGNVCGVNAQRTNNPYAYYTFFKNALQPNPPTITLLNRTHNTVSEACKEAILQNVTVPVAEVDFPQGKNPVTPIVAAINKVPANSGLLVLPVDVFFGFSNTINTAAANLGLTVFWPAEEFAQHGQKHFGSSQVDCGEKFGKQADVILAHGIVPSGPPGPKRWELVNPK